MARVKKVFVSVGTHPQPFDRLLEELDLLIEKGKLKGEVFAQTGNSNYRPRNYKFKDFIQEKEYNKRFKEADIVISHGGAGTIINALRAGKRLVVVPRLEKFGEHTNDHQLDLARALEKEGKVLSVFSIKELGRVLEKAKSFRPDMGSNREKLVREIAGFLNSLG